MKLVTSSLLVSFPLDVLNLPFPIACLTGGLLSVVLDSIVLSIVLDFSIFWMSNIMKASPKDSQSCF